jgi:hypothetical protein
LGAWLGRNNAFVQLLDQEGSVALAALHTNGTENDAKSAAEPAAMSAVIVATPDVLPVVPFTFTEDFRFRSPYLAPRDNR